MIRFKAQGEEGNFFAYQGQCIIGHVVTRFDGVIVWKLDGVRTKFITKGYGESTSIKNAKHSLRRAWQRWLDAHRLMDRP